MDNITRNNKHNFLYPKARYHGQNYIEGLIFNDNLQEFSHKISYISALHTNGKLSSKEAYDYIEQLWENTSLSPPKPWRSSK